MDLKRVFGILLFFLPVLTAENEKKSLNGTGCLITILKIGFSHDTCEITDQHSMKLFPESVEFPCKDQCTFEVDVDECENNQERKKRATNGKSRKMLFNQSQFKDVLIDMECASKNLYENICKCSGTSTSSYNDYSTNNNREKESTTLEPQIGTSDMYSEHQSYEMSHVSGETHNLTALVVGFGVGSFILGVVLSLVVVFIVRKCRIQGNQNNDLKCNVNNPIYNKNVEGSESSRRGSIPNTVSTMPIADTNTAYSEVKILSDNKGDIYNHLHEKVTPDTSGLNSDYDHAKPLKEQLSPDREYSHLTSKIDSEDFKSNEDIQQSARIEENADENNDNYFTLEKIN
ncbi:uncharacterized protein LOC134273948 isoform X2 [Saccostrea cucullata]|uniref:uncharacterized protein LOC134273948 isoform X2 n=1 Tax=Saccostrea cuccullata TaxID=36930 RepID=UPI002ED46CFF